MAERDHYADLGVSRDATSDEIGRAFRRLAAKYHPDRNPGDKQAEEQFKRIAEAYNVLSDPKSRAAYDRGGSQQVEVDTGFHGFDSTEDVFSRFGDIFGDLFGERMRRHAAPERGQDFEVEVPLSTEEAARGGQKTISIELPAACETCEGTGARPGRSPECSSCHGTGYVSRRAREAGGFFSVSTPCPRCAGSGIDPEAACTTCGGRGVLPRLRELEVTIPPGTADGTLLRLRGVGGPGRRGAPPGDLRVRVHVPRAAPREDLDVRRDVEIDLPTAALGGMVDVALPTGTVEMKVPAGTQPGQQFRLSGQGRADASGRHGDAIVTARVRIPTSVSAEERRLLEELRAKQSRSDAASAR
ncbi:MAG TPA: J domain-containing protein [Planctomycetota bacterium]|jgi:molecular chaperone DnaJ|nr:J domain-containing protein [Planctomycetota bacterium]